jgi:hypothetical protein
MSPCTRTSLALALFVIVGIASARSQQSSGVAQTPQVEVTLAAVATPINGVARQVATAEAKLDVGGAGTLAYAVADNLCWRAIGGPTVIDATADHAWTVNAALVSVQIDKIAVDVSVERQDGQPLRVTKRELRHLVLSEGAPHVLDFVEADDHTPGRCNAKNTVLQVSAAIVEREALAREVLDYDLWFTHTDANGRTVTRHTTVTGLQGQAIPFTFRPVRWPVQMLAPSAAADLSIEEDVSGTIRGRVRPDGTIDAAFTTKRSLVHMYPDGSSGSVGDESGRKSFSAHNGEVVQLEMPPLSGSAGLRSRDGSTMGANYSELFANHAASVIVRITRD